MDVELLTRCTQLIGELDRFRELLGSDIEAEYQDPRAGDVRHSLASVERAERLLGYRPEVPWREGLRRTVAWYREASTQPGDAH